VTQKVNCQGPRRAQHGKKPALINTVSLKEGEEEEEAEAAEEMLRMDRLRWKGRVSVRRVE
jgi:hypothetical protein